MSRPAAAPVGLCICTHDTNGHQDPAFALGLDCAAARGWCPVLMYLITPHLLPSLDPPSQAQLVREARDVRSEWLEVPRECPVWLTAAQFALLSAWTCFLPTTCSVAITPVRLTSWSRARSPEPPVVF